MTGSAAAEVLRTLLREPLYFRNAFFGTPTLELDQWQMLRVCGGVQSSVMMIPLLAATGATQAYRDPKG